MLPIPPQNLRFMGEDDEGFLQMAERILQPVMGRFNLSAKVLDVGCGYGRLSYGLRKAGFTGKYVGFDILKRHIDWLNENVADDRYRFAHFDGRNDRYNPDGKLSLADYLLPVDEPQDLITSLSVFTHLYEADIRLYLRMISEVMQPGALLYATWFLVNPDQQAFDRSGRSARPMPYRLNDTTLYQDEADPLLAIGHAEQAVREWIAEAGLWVSDAIYGSWCGRKTAATYQDILLIRK